jgi:hypothetical protein
MLNKCIILSGASSKTGLFFLTILSKSKYRRRVFVIARNKKSKSLFKNFNLDISFVESDLKKIKSKKYLFPKNSIFLHVAGIPYSLAVLEFCIFNKIKKIISVHTSGIFSKHKPESKTYKIIDSTFKKKCIAHKIFFATLYPTLIFGTSDDGNISRLIVSLKKFFFFPIIGDGFNFFQPIYYKDLSKAFYLILENEEKTIKNKNYILSGKYPISYLEILKFIQLKTYSKNFFFHIPVRFSVCLINIAIFFYKSFPINKYQALRMLENRSFNHSAASLDFKFNPIGFKIGVARQIKEFF